MKISYNWLKDYLECDLAPEAVTEALTSIGLEVDSLEQVEEIPGGLAGVIVAEVVECVDHPDSDHLHVTKLNTGDAELLQVVCGAPNVAAGQKVIVADLGCVLYDGDNEFVIKKSKLRGVESNGMICAEDEIGVGTSHAGIIELPLDVPVGTLAKDGISASAGMQIYYEKIKNNQITVNEFYSKSTAFIGGIQSMKLGIVADRRFPIGFHNLSYPLKAL